MKSIDILVEEHKYIKMVLGEIRRQCITIVHGEKVDIIANAIGYEQLLLKHIDKEDNAIYKHAEKRLSKETLEKLDAEFEAVERDSDNTAIRSKYMEFAKSLKK